MRLGVVTLIYRPPFSMEWMRILLMPVMTGPMYRFDPLFQLFALKVRPGECKLGTKSVECDRTSTRKCTKNGASVKWEIIISLPTLLPTAENATLTGMGMGEETFADPSCSLLYIVTFIVYSLSILIFTFSLLVVCCLFGNYLFPNSFLACSQSFINLFFSRSEGKRCNHLASIHI